MYVLYMRGTVLIGLHLVSLQCQEQICGDDIYIPIVSPHPPQSRHQKGTKCSKMFPHREDAYVRENAERSRKRWNVFRFCCQSDIH